jgi:AraC-like DNA-binding protein
MPERGKIMSQMKRYTTPGGWEVFHGREWKLHFSLDLGLSTAIEAVRYHHFDGTESMENLDWVLDCHYARSMRYRSGTSGWKQRTPGTWHLYGSKTRWFQDSRRSKLPLHALWIRFHGCEKLGLNRLVDNPSGMARIHDSDGWLTEHIRALALMGDSPGDVDDEYPRVLSGLTDIIYRLLHSKLIKVGEYSLTTSGESRREDPLVTKVNDYLMSHLREPLTLSRLAQELHTSVSTLHRHYATTSKDSITQTLIRLRIARVKKLLIQGATIAEAAYSTGFYDPHHLSKTFRRLEGIPPSEFISRFGSKSGKKPGKLH